MGHVINIHLLNHAHNRKNRRRSMCCKSFAGRMCSAHVNITCGVNPCVKDQIHKCKEMGGKRQTPHGQPGGGRGVPLGRGVLEKACWGGAEGNLESLDFGAIWGRDGNKCVSEGQSSVEKGSEHAGEIQRFLGQCMIRYSLEGVRSLYLLAEQADRR